MKYFEESIAEKEFADGRVGYVSLLTFSRARVGVGAPGVDVIDDLW